jgi:hypothetical protein
MIAPCESAELAGMSIGGSRYSSFPTWSAAYRDNMTAAALTPAFDMSLPSLRQGHDHMLSMRGVFVIRCMVTKVKKRVIIGHRSLRIGSLWRR